MCLYPDIRISQFMEYALRYSVDLQPERCDDWRPESNIGCEGKHSRHESSTETSVSWSISIASSIVLPARGSPTWRSEALIILRPASDLTLHEGGERLLTAARLVRDFEDEVEEPLAHVLVVQSLVEGIGEFIEDRFRRRLGSKQGEPTQYLELRQPCFLVLSWLALFAPKATPKPI